jgi:hypothetical protein
MEEEVALTIPDFGEMLLRSCGMNILYRGAAGEEILPRGDHWAIGGEDLQEILEGHNQEIQALFANNPHSCEFTEDNDGAIEHALAFAQANQGRRLYSYRTTRPLQLIVICHCLDRLSKEFFGVTKSSLNTEERRIYYCGLFEQPLQSQRLDGFLNIDFTNVGASNMDVAETFICRPDIKLENLGEYNH